MIPKLALLLACVAVASGNPAAGKPWHWKSLMPVVTPNGSVKSGRIVGGMEATPHSFPYQVALFTGDMYYCSGSLISPEWILTAAQCVAPFSLLHAVMGAHSIVEEEDSQIRMQCTEFVIHEDYDIVTFDNDIALIKLYEPVPFSDEIAAVGLPPSEVVVGDVLTATGWGHYSDEFNDNADTLRRVDVPVMSNPDCDAIYGFIGDGVFCTDTTGGKGTCTFDTGGPISKDGIIHGISKFHSLLFCEEGFPNVYTRVHLYLDWIKRHTGISP